MARCAFGRVLCEREAGHGTHGNFCEEHAAYLHQVALDLGFRKRPRSDPAAERERRRQIEDAALKLARLVWESDQPVREAARAIGVPASGFAYLEGKELAKQRGWVVMQSGRGYARGRVRPPQATADAMGRLPVAERAKQLGRYVHEHGGLVTRKEAAAALGVSPQGGFHRVVKAAKEGGWIKTQHGPKGGFVPVGSAPTG